MTVHLAQSGTSSNDFILAFMRCIAKSLGNHYDDNYDVRRFGPSHTSTRERAQRLFLDRGLMTSGHASTSVSTAIELVAPRLDKLEWLFSILADQESKDLVVQLMAFRALGYRKVKLPLNTPQHWAALVKLDSLTKGAETLDLGYLDWKIHKMDLSSIGYPLTMFYSSLGVYNDFVVEQYRCETDTGTLEVKPGDCVIDAGGCYGDTALYFSIKAGPAGKVFSFEFLPDSIAIFRRNMELNPQASARVKLVEHPIWSVSGESLFVEACGPGTHVKATSDDPNAVRVSTLTIDDLFREQVLERIDFIKMDIEGAELQALKGAERTLIGCKPKLAIALYHRIDDFWEIPQYLDSLKLGYRFYIRHFTIYSEETMLFAVADE